MRRSGPLAWHMQCLGPMKTPWKHRRGLFNEEGFREALFSSTQSPVERSPLVRGGLHPPIAKATSDRRSPLMDSEEKPSFVGEGGGVLLCPQEVTLQASVSPLAQRLYDPLGVLPNMAQTPLQPGFSPPPTGTLETRDPIIKEMSLKQARSWRHLKILEPMA